VDLPSLDEMVAGGDALQERLRREQERREQVGNTVAASSDWPGLPFRLASEGSWSLLVAGCVPASCVSTRPTPYV
jgi:hypothetical protein